MCGGPQETFDKVEPVMKCMGTHVRLMGSHGSGTAAKLVRMLCCAETLPILQLCRHLCAMRHDW